MPTLSSIAVVDDDLDMRDALAGLVEAMAFESHPFDSAAALLDGFRAGDFDCLITDVRMPGIDGLELQRRIKAVDPQLPIIFVSSYDDARTRDEALRNGAMAFLSKPVNVDDLERRLRAAVLSRRSAAA